MFCHLYKGIRGARRGGIEVRSMYIASVVAVVHFLEFLSYAERDFVNY